MGCSYDFIKEGDTAKTRSLYVNFIGANKFNNRDTALVRIIVRDNINYPQRVLEYVTLRKEVENYAVQLKGNFMMLDKNVKSTKNTRTTFDMTSAATALEAPYFLPWKARPPRMRARSFRVLAWLCSREQKPLHPARFTSKLSRADQNSIKRLDFTLSDNSLG